MRRAEVLEAESLTQALLQIQDGVFDLVFLDVNLSNVRTVDALTAESDPRILLRDHLGLGNACGHPRRLSCWIARVYFKAPIRRGYS